MKAAKRTEIKNLLDFEEKKRDQLRPKKPSRKDIKFSVLPKKL